MLAAKGEHRSPHDHQTTTASSRAPGITPHGKGISSSSRPKPRLPSSPPWRSACSTGSRGAGHGLLQLGASEVSRHLSRSAARAVGHVDAVECQDVRVHVQSHRARLFVEIAATAPAGREQRSAARENVWLFAHLGRLGSRQSVLEPDESRERRSFHHRGRPGRRPSQRSSAPRRDRESSRARRLPQMSRELSRYKCPQAKSPSKMNLARRRDCEIGALESDCSVGRVRLAFSRATSSGSCIATMRAHRHGCAARSDVRVHAASQLAGRARIRRHPTGGQHITGAPTANGTAGHADPNRGRRSLRSLLGINLRRHRGMHRLLQQRDRAVRRQQWMR